MTVDAIYIIHHTDVGFTNDQPIFWEMQYRFIDLPGVTNTLSLVSHFKVTASPSTQPRAIEALSLPGEPITSTA